MATFLTLCNDLRRECGISGTDMTATTNQSGENLRVVNWVSKAWIDIQNRHTNWRWMRHGFTVSTSSGDDSYAYTDCTDSTTSTTIARFSHWWANDEEDPFKCYLSSGGVSGEYRLIYLPWETFKWLYKIGTQNNGKPVHVSIDPQNNIRIGPKPDDTYVITGDFQRGVQVLSATSDEPDMPSKFHDLVTYEAMKKYAGYESAPEAFARGNLEGSRLMRQLEANQLPPMRLAPPLV